MKTTLNIAAFQYFRGLGIRQRAPRLSWLDGPRSNGSAGRRRRRSVVRIAATRDADFSRFPFLEVIDPLQQ
jgi:hypothetical protein